MMMMLCSTTLMAKVEWYTYTNYRQHHTCEFKLVIRSYSTRFARLYSSHSFVLHDNAPNTVHTVWTDRTCAFEKSLSAVDKNECGGGI